MTTPECDLCGRPDSGLTEGVCPACRAKYAAPGTGGFQTRPTLPLSGEGAEALDTAPAMDAEAGLDDACHPYTAELAARVRDIVGDYFQPEVSAELLEHVICEALFQLAIDLRRGREIELEYLGSFVPQRYCDDAISAIAWIQDPALTRPLPLGGVI